MNKDLEHNNFIIVPSFISKERAQVLEKQFFELEEAGGCIKDEQSPLSSSAHNYAPFLELLCEKTYEVNNLVGEAVLPTYTYARIYKTGEFLKKHKDRPACEISVTVMVGSDGTSWPIYMNGTEINMEPGDAAVYLGCEIEHWREEFKGDWHAQTFLHYVDANGPNKEWFKDKRIIFGLSKN